MRPSVDPVVGRKISANLNRGGGTEPHTREKHVLASQLLLGLVGKLVGTRLPMAIAGDLFGPI